MTDIGELLAQYDVWDTARDRASARESTDHPVSSSTWEDSDDEGVDLAHQFAGALRQEVLCLVCKEPIRLGWIHPRSNGNHGSIECGTGDGSIATASNTPVPVPPRPVEPRQIWTCRVFDRENEEDTVTVHATEEQCWESLRETYDPYGPLDEPPVAIVERLEEEKNLRIEIDVHEIEI